MSIRRRLAVVFIGVNALAALVVLSFLLVQYSRVRGAFDDQREQLQDRSARLLARNMIREGLESEARAALVRDDIHSLVIDISELSFWDDDPIVLERLDRAALVRYTEDQGVMMFPPRPALRFAEDGSDGITEAEIRNLVVRTRDVEVRRDSAGRLLVAGALSLDVDTAKNWGVCFRLRKPPPLEFDPGRTVLIVGGILFAGVALVLAFSYAFFRRAVLNPLAELEAAALQTSAGNYEQAVSFADQSDELGSVARAMNQMMADLRHYRDRMEALVAEATDRFVVAEKQLGVTQRLAAMGRLAAGVAHEVNNPLGGVLNALRTLGREDLSSERRRRYLDIAEDGVQRIGSIVRRLLETAPKRSVVEPLVLAESVGRARDLAQPRFDERQTEIQVDIPVDLRVLADANELVQVFLNLFLNGADACDPGGTIRIQARGNRGHAQIEVSDDGRGMSAEQLEKAFDLFYTTKPGTEGTGLGLAIVHNIVTGHGGDIEVASRPGEGTRFRLSLPLAEEAPEESP